MLLKVSKPKVSLAAHTKSHTIVLHPNTDVSPVHCIFCNVTQLLRSHDSHAVCKLHGCMWVAGMAGGLRASGPKADLALIVADADAVAAGVFTTNVMCAAPVLYCKKVLAKNKPARAVRRLSLIHRSSIIASGSLQTPVAFLGC